MLFFCRSWRWMIDLIFQLCDFLFAGFYLVSLFYVNYWVYFNEKMKENLNLPSLWPWSWKWDCLKLFVFQSKWSENFTFLYFGEINHLIIVEKCLIMLSVNLSHVFLGLCIFYVGLPRSNSSCGKEWKLDYSHFFAGLTSPVAVVS